MKIWEVIDIHIQILSLKGRFTMSKEERRGGNADKVEPDGPR